MNKVVKLQEKVIEESGRKISDSKILTASRERPDLEIQILVRIFKFSLNPESIINTRWEVISHD